MKSELKDTRKEADRKLEEVDQEMQDNWAKVIKLPAKDDDDDELEYDEDEDDEYDDE